MSDKPDDWGHEDWGHEDWGHEDWGHEDCEVCNSAREQKCESCADLRAKLTAAEGWRELAFEASAQRDEWVRRAGAAEAALKSLVDLTKYSGEVKELLSDPLMVAVWIKEGIEGANALRDETIAENTRLQTEVEREGKLREETADTLAKVLARAEAAESRVAELEAEVARQKDDIAERQAEDKRILDDARPGDEMHCSCVPTLRLRIAELEAEVDAAYMKGCAVSEKAWRKDATEAALKWVLEELRRFGFIVSAECEQKVLDDGAKALLWEGEP